MPTYLVELTAGDFARVSATVGRTTLGVWTVRGQEQDGATALANARQIIADYDDYFGYPFPLPKLDSIATPGGFTGAMENWGAITYNDQLLLVTPSSTLHDRQRALLGPGARDGPPVERRPGHDGLVGRSVAERELRILAGSRRSRAAPSRLALVGGRRRRQGRRHGRRCAPGVARDPAARHQRTGSASAFDPQITYAKGAAVLRMLEAFVGPAEFRDGVRSYMRAHAYSNATTADLWLALDAASGRTVSDIAADWTGQPGYPLVTATVRCDAAGRRSVTLAQQRFLLEGEDPGHSHWRVPLRLRAGIAAAPHSRIADHGRPDRGGGPLRRAALAHRGRDRLLSGGLRRRHARHRPARLLRACRAATGSRCSTTSGPWCRPASSAWNAYLGLVSALGADRNGRAWSQVIGALDQIETMSAALPATAHSPRMRARSCSRWPPGWAGMRVRTMPRRCSIYGAKCCARSENGATPGSSPRRSGASMRTSRRTPREYAPSAARPGAPAPPVQRSAPTAAVSDHRPQLASVRAPRSWPTAVAR